MSTPPATTATAPFDRQPNWIDVVGDGWVDTRTDEPFVPRGVNLLRKVPGAGDVLFARYDPDWTDEQLEQIADHGFNTVRFFLDLCMSCVGSSQGVRDSYLDHLADFLARLEAHGLVALPTSNDVPDPGYSERLPCCEPFGGYRNSLYLSAEGHDIAAEYFTDLLTGLRDRGAPMHVVMAWQLANEQFFLRDVPPISLTSGEITTADGETYDLADDDAVESMVANNLIAYVDHVGDAVRTADDGALVTIGYFSSEDPAAGRDADDNRWVLPEVVIRRSSVDFIDLHAYTGLGGRWAPIVAAFGIDATVDIPLLLGEFGAFDVAYDDAASAATAMVRWQADSCAFGFDGWLVWLWGEQRDDEVIPVNAGNGEIASALAPADRPDACEATGFESANLALDRPATASLEEGGEYVAASAVDGSAATWWTAPEGPPQWIEVDLEDARTVGRVDILIGSVSPPGPQTHRVLVRGEGEAQPGTYVGEVSADVVAGDVLTVELDPPRPGVRHVRVETVAMDGWVILHEVSVYAP